MTTGPTGEAASSAIRRHAVLEPSPRSARAARRIVAAVLADARRSDLVDSAELLVSELVTNAIVHARTDIVLDVAAGPHGLRVSVQDTSPHLPSPRHYGTSATTGRGLELVELMADRHGTDVAPGGAGKSVWFELGSASTDDATVADDPAAAPQPPPRHVVLPGLPVALALAWQQNADALLREHVLADWHDDPTGQPPHAADLSQGAAHDAFALLADALGTLAGLERPAGTPARVDLALAVPPDEVAGFAELSGLLDRIQVRAESGQMLAPATQPEITAMRRWICEQVLAQAGGAAGTPWPGLPDELTAPAVPAPQWDLDAVRRAAGAVVAADDANRILAVSEAAMTLLGWDESLVGRRITTIIPPRLREAHVAAFTLHLLTGEGAIIDREVTVPALHRDGSEVTVALLVRRETAEAGRLVFTADLREL